RRPRAPHPGRADERARPRRDPRVPRHDPRLRRGRTHRPPLVALARRGGEDLRRGRDRRSRPSRRPGLDRRAGRRRRADDPRSNQRRPAGAHGHRRAPGGRVRPTRGRGHPRRTSSGRGRRACSGRPQPPHRPVRPCHPPLRARPCVARTAVPGDHVSIGGSSMSTTALTADIPRTRKRRWSPRLAQAELLKLRKRRGLVAAVAALTILPMVIAYVVLLSMHANDSVAHGPAGGLDNFTSTMDLLTTLTVVAAVLIGATLGTGDLSAGVFRELVVTGRS